MRQINYALVIYLPSYNPRNADFFYCFAYTDRNALDILVSLAGPKKSKEGSVVYLGPEGFIDDPVAVALGFELLTLPKYNFPRSLRKVSSPEITQGVVESVYKMKRSLGRVGQLSHAPAL